MKQLKRSRSKFLAMLVTFMMIFTMIPQVAFASINYGEYPFTEITTDAGDAISITDEGTVDYNYYSDVPYYHVTIPEGATEVYVTHSSSEDPFADMSYGSAYGYYAETAGWTGGYMTYNFEATADGYKIVLPLSESVTDWMTGETTDMSFVADEDGNVEYAVAVERNDYSPICFFTFEFVPGEPAEHVHSYDAGVVTTEPTCTEAGVKTFICSGCEEGTEGHSYTEEVAKLGHSYGAWNETKAPTCTADGEETHTCGTCGATETQPITKLGHSYDDGVVTTEPTCTEAGVKTFTCSNCSEETEGHTKTETVPAAGHQRGDDTECDICGDVAPMQDENGVYQINNAKELLWFAKAVNGGETGISGELTADIDLSEVENWPGIGISGKAFAGTFDGNNKTIALNGSAFGVFVNATGTATKYVEIKNLVTAGTVKNSAIVSTAEFVKIENCINRAEVGGDGKNSYIAGIVGSTARMKSNCLYITDCSNEGKVTGTSYVAGLLGYSDYSNAIITKSFNSGDITGTSYVGGLVGSIKGYPKDSKIENCYNTGRISGGANSAGIGGFLYNGVKISNCYNAGEAAYAIAGGLYNNSPTITNTYYRGDLCTYSVPDTTQSAGTYTGNRGTAKTSAEMSSAEFAEALGDAFKQSCPSAVLEYQTASEHTMENGICIVCKYGNDMPTEYNVTFNTPTGVEIDGDTTFKAGSDYTFRVNILAGFDKTDEFAVYADNNKLEEVEGVYTVENPSGPFYITVKGVKEQEGVLGISLPAKGDGYRIVPCEGYGETVERGKEYKFTVEFADGFKAGDEFAVKVNDEIVTADKDSVYTIENITKAQIIKAEGVDIIPGENTVTINLEITSGEKEFMCSENTDEIMMDKQVELEYFDLALYGLEKYYYNPYCYVDENGKVNGQQKAGNRETAYDVITSIHAFIYMTEVYYLGYDAEDAGKGYSDTVDTDNDGKSDFEEAVSWTQGVGSSFMDLWGLGSNLNYHINYEYPIAYPEWGSTSDQQPLKNGDRLSVHMIKGAANGSGFGLFVVNDEDNDYDRTDKRDSVTVTQGETIKLTHYLATQGDKYTTTFVAVPDKELYWVEAGAESAVMGGADSEWSRDGFGDMTSADFKTDAKGEIVIDTTNIEPGTYYIGAAGAFYKGDGSAGSDGFVSNGAESGPAYFKLTVEAVDQPTQPEDPAEPSEPDQEKDVVTRYNNLEADYLENKEELKAAGYDTVEKIENKLFEEMTMLVGYVVTKDNTTILDIELVYEGTDKPVAAEDFPEEGKDIVIPFDKIFGGKTVDYSKYDYTVVHMFSTDTESHKAGDVEVLVAEVTEEGLKVHVNGLSPFAISYVEKDDNTGGENQPTEPDQPTEPENPVNPEEPSDDMDEPTDDENESIDDSDEPDVQQNDNEQNVNKDDSVKTGDDSNIFIYFLAMLMAGIVAIGVRRKEN